MDREGGNKERMRKCSERISLHFLCKAAAGCVTLLPPCLSCLSCFSLFVSTLLRNWRDKKIRRENKNITTISARLRDVYCCVNCGI